MVRLPFSSIHGAPSKRLGRIAFPRHSAVRCSACCQTSSLYFPMTCTGSFRISDDQTMVGRIFQQLTMQCLSIHSDLVHRVRTCHSISRRRGVLPRDSYSTQEFSFPSTFSCSCASTHAG